MPKKMKPNVSDESTKIDVPPERKALIGVIKAWESLAGGTKYSPAVISEWLNGPMVKAINKARKALK